VLAAHAQRANIKVGTGLVDNTEIEAMLYVIALYRGRARHIEFTTIATNLLIRSPHSPNCPSGGEGRDTRG
jgi:hypothetical protein